MQVWFYVLTFLKSYFLWVRKNDSDLHKSMIFMGYFINSWQSTKGLKKNLTKIIGFFAELAQKILELLQKLLTNAPTPDLANQICQNSQKIVPDAEIWEKNAWKSSLFRKSQYVKWDLHPNLRSPKNQWHFSKKRICSPCHWRYQLSTNDKISINQ